MKAPDKIYLHGYSFDDEPCKDWHTEPKIKGMRGYPVQNVEYIRKDYLLELIEEEEKFWDDGKMIFGKLKKELNEI